MMFRHGRRPPHSVVQAAYLPYRSVTSMFLRGSLQRGELKKSSGQGESNGLFFSGDGTAVTL